MRRTLLFFGLTAVLYLCNILQLHAQGSTSSRITGLVTSEGDALPGATIVAIHEPTGAEYGTVTNVEGRFTLNNLNVGGPYQITTNYVGYRPAITENVYLTLGQTLNLEISLEEASTELEEVIVSANGIFDGNRTGSETNIDEEAISNMPTVERGLNDYTRLTPQALVGNSAAVNSGGISFAGINNRFNAIFIDGAVNNDVFGLANSGTNGGQAGISPISPDALEQIQVVLAPYDVTLGGFAGGGINAVTRSGTNEFEGSAYYFLRNENLTGKTPTDNSEIERVKLAPFKVQTYGARLGGPIIKNKLFFFANVEIERREEPRPFIPEDYLGNASIADLEAIQNRLINDFGYNPGGFLNNAQTTDGEKVLVKLDWNVNRAHKLSVRHSYVKALTNIFPRPSNTSLPFANRGYVFPSTTNSFAAELKSNLGQTASNNLIFGYTRVRDDRDVAGAPFPSILMQDGPAQIAVGTDNFSYSNIVFQDVFTLTDNFNLYKGKHTFTFGTHNEFFQVQNLFSIFSTPQYNYFTQGGISGYQRFLNGENADQVLFGHEQLAAGQSEIRLGDEATNLGPTFNALQMAFYAQDEYQATPDLKLTIGLRADIPIFLENPPLENTDFNDITVPLVEEYYDLQGARASNTPNTQVLWSPRVGVNWDVNGDKKTQIRGGIGVFTSRVPWVWPGGMYIRNGLNSSVYFNARFITPEGIPVYGDPDDWRTELFNATSPSGDVDLFVEDFKYPQVFRTSAAIDQQLPWGLVGTLEFLYTKTLNNYNVTSVNLKPSEANLEGADNRPIFNKDDLIDPTYTNITLVDNTNQGYSWNITGQLNKTFAYGFSGGVSYSYTKAESIQDGTGFINYNNWDNIVSVNGKNNPPLSLSTYGAGSRITTFLNYRKEYLEHFATSLSLFYNGQSGQPYSYVYNDNDNLTYQSTNSTNNIPIYVPANENEILLANQIDGDGNLIKSAAQQWEELDAFIENDEYLSTRRGQYAERNASRTPFENIIDLKIAQDFFIRTASGQKHTLQVSLDVFNFTNMLNKNWGRRYFVTDAYFPLIQHVGFLAENGNPTNQPVFIFDDPGEPYSVVQSGIYSARWSAQLGLRYTF
ncbi:TonB-dependent receptor [Catalinimonas niigatensis]|uniref:TonB-dependent receptor n=1 Tax=Catalinimonas niigatensis TaxID=1397264 RepID=UPI002666681C|nr:TonB-dependent receptor [Catalinimonas niigatensis]WPP50203.1 TonB-dependent receptor [Catalinimonas niigatensis]